MTRRTASRSYKPRLCAECGGALAEKRPVYLVATGSGKIVGPYHSGCAEKIAIREKGQKQRGETLNGKVWGQLPLPREETLPW